MTEFIDALLPEIRNDEGWRPYVYKDHLGFDTIGYGFLVDPRKSAGLPKAVAEFWLRYAINERVDDLRKRWPAFEQQPTEVKIALSNMAYQLGPSGVLNFRKMIEALEAGDRASAADHALDSAWAKQTPSRAKRVAATIRGT